MTITRRAVMATAAALPFLQASDAAGGLVALEHRCGGHLGVAVLDTQSGRRLAHRVHERFPMCSTFKVVLAAAVLARIDKGVEKADRVVAYDKKDLVTWSPVTGKQAGGMRVSDLLQALLEQSDNTAANLLLDSIGGPAGWTAFARSIGDDVSRLDRTEPELNVVGPGDVRDTTTPAAMLKNLQTVFLGKVLSEDSRGRLEAWMRASVTGLKCLRAGVPAGWTVADKSGSGSRSRNDIALIRPPGRGPILACVYCTDSKLDRAGTDTAIADVGRLIAGMV